MEGLPLFRWREPKLETLSGNSRIYNRRLKVPVVSIASCKLSNPLHAKRMTVCERGQARCPLTPNGKPAAPTLFAERRNRCNGC